jgi:signal transduction histidine kinase
MAEKIEHQIEGQRELLAGVSHEIRSPLARLRVLVELERDVQGHSGRLDSMDAELSELDSLVGQLLAQSRLEFQSLDKKSLRAVEVAKTALERASLSTALLRDDSTGAFVNVDASLFVRALMNLLENAKVHGRSVESLTIRVAGKQVLFEIADSGPGLEPSELNRVFEPFVGEGKRSGLGLGLALVQRIVLAHGGRVWLANRADNGAIATIELAQVEGSASTAT